MGSDVVHCGILTAIVQVAKRDEFGDTGLEQRSLACTGQQLIPDPLCWKWRWNVQPEKSVCHKTMDLGSV